MAGVLVRIWMPPVKDHQTFAVFSQETGWFLAPLVYFKADDVFPVSRK